MNDQKCKTCDGSGLIWRSIPSFNGKRRGVEFQEWCLDCQGSGRKGDFAQTAKPTASESGRKAKPRARHKR